MTPVIHSLSTAHEGDRRALVTGEACAGRQPAGRGPAGALLAEGDAAGGTQELSKSSESLCAPG